MEQSVWEGIDPRILVEACPLASDSVECWWDTLCAELTSLPKEASWLTLQIVFAAGHQTNYKVLYVVRILSNQLAWTDTSIYM